MKKIALLPVALLALPLALRSATVYWDSNGNLTAGAGATPTGTWGTDTFWNADPAGLGGSATTGWTAGNDAIFSAGSDATGAWTLSVLGTQVAASVLVEEGNITVGSGTIDTGAGTFTIGTGAGSTARVNIASNARFNTVGGKVILNGGTLFQTNPSSGASFISQAKGLEVSANGGTVGYDDGAGVNAFSAYLGTITGTGGTTVNGGVGTLTKIGPDEFRYQGTGLPNSTYAKLVVNEGLFRLGLDSGISDERGFGAVPTAFLADAITLNNGGSIGTSFSATLHANRGITLGPSGGNFDTSLGDLTIPGAITGTGISKIGSGTLTLRGNNDYTGTTSVNSGVLQVGSATALGSTVGDTRVSGLAEVQFDGTLLGGSVTTGEPFVIAGGGSAGTTGAINVTNTANATLTGRVFLTGDATVTVSGTSTVAFTNLSAFTNTAGAPGATLTLQGGAISTGDGGSISGVIQLFGVTKAEGGTWTLSGNNNYLGATSISGGTLIAAASGALGSTFGGTTVASGATLGFQGNIVYTPLEAVSIAGTGVGANGAINNISGTNSFAGPITMTAASSIGAAAGALTLTNTIGGGFALTKVGTGTLTLRGNNDYTGTTFVNSGVLQVGSATALGSTVGDTVVSFGAEVQFDGTLGGSVTTAEPFHLRGAGSSGSTGAINVTNGANAILSGPMSLNTDATFTVSGTSTVAFTNPSAFTSTFFSENLTLQGGAISAGGGGSISGVIALGGGGLTKAEAGTWTLSGNNSYQGATSINGGTLIAAASGALGTRFGLPGVTTVASGATLGFQGNIAYAPLESVSIAGSGVGANGAINNISGTNSFAGPVTMTADSSIGAAAGALTLTNTIGGGFALTKVGPGTLILSNTGNNYGGTTNVNDGTLQLGSSDVVPNTSSVALNGGTLATAGFSDTVSSLSMLSSSVIDMGGAALGSILNFSDIAGGWTGTLSIHNWTGALGGPGTDKLLFASTATGPGAAQFYSDSGTNAIGSGAAFSGNELVPVPEPGAVLASLLLLAPVAWRERRHFLRYR